MKRRLLALTLALAMVMTLLPVTALAEDTAPVAEATTPGTGTTPPPTGCLAEITVGDTTTQYSDPTAFFTAIKTVTTGTVRATPHRKKCAENAVQW